MRKVSETASENAGTIKRPKTYVVHDRGQTSQRSNFRRRSKDYKQKDGNSRVTSAATSVDRINSFRIPVRQVNDRNLEQVNILAMFPEIPVGGRLKFFCKNWNVPRKLESNYSGRMGIVSN